MLRSMTLLLSLPFLALGHNDASLLHSVPGPPEWATLNVIGANTLQVTFAPPLWDGGSPITSYLVEWDKTAGIPEVQRVITSQNLNANEIQTITTSAPDINEIQVVRTSGSGISEVQAITVSPPYGDTTIESAYGFAVSIDTINVGGSLQYSGQISANAVADGSRTSMAQILENMANVHERPTVTRSDMNPDGGHTYLVTFPASMGNVPEMEVFMSDLPISITTVQEGNELEGSFRLEFFGELTADIPFDASSSVMQSKLESLDAVGAVTVTRSLADVQSGFTWEIEFLSDSNGGNLPSMKAHGDGLRTSNPLGGANVEVSTGRDGSYINGSFTLAFRDDVTNPIQFDADASTVKEELEALSTIARVHIERTPLDIVGGCTWTILFLEDGSRVHRGDMPLLVVDSFLTGTLGGSTSIVVAEERKGTIKEVQTITVDGGGANVDPTSSFKLRFEGEETGDIPALPLGGNTCLGSTKAKQIITSSTVDTSDVGGDASVSHLTSFALTYNGYITSKIMANGASCDDNSAIIAQELMQLPHLNEVSVSGSNTGVGDEGCTWVVTFLSVMGNPELMTVTAYNGDLSVGPSHSVTVGDAYSIIRDTIAISQPEGFEGDINLIQSELSKLSSIGIVTVSSMSALPDEFGQCTWNVTFESKAGDISPLEVARSGTSDYSTDTELNSGNRVIVTDDTVRGTSKPVSGDFRLKFDGELTGYIPHNASPELVESSLDSLPNIGDVSVTRLSPDVNGCYSWDVTFISDLGPLSRLVADDLDLTGTVASISVSKIVEGALPPFIGEDYGHAVVQGTQDLSILIQNLKQGIPYYVRISALNALGASPSIMPYPPHEIPFPQPPAPPSGVIVTPKDGSTLAVAILAPFHDGGDDVISYRVDYGTQPFNQERQRISLTCDPQPAIQSVTTSAMDINEIQYLVIDSSYSGAGRISEVQNIRCDASGGTFSLSLGDETAYISHDADSQSIKDALQSLSVINEVAIAFNNGRETACAPFDGSSAGDFSVTFQSLTGIDGDLPQMTAETSGLEGARHVVVTTEVEGDAPLSGSIKLAFRGAMSAEIDVSLEPNELAAAIELALEELDTVQEGGVTVEAVNLVHGGHEKISSIEFQGSGVGGNIEALSVVPEHLLILGSSADAFVLSDGESYAARNGLDSVSSLVGNELSGNFRLRLRGHTTRRIPFNASVDEMKARLEELPNIGQVDVQMSGPSKEMAYTWLITFLSSPGYFPPSARNIDDLEVINELSTSVASDSSALINVETIQVGDSMLEGQFQVAYNDGTKIETTRPLQSFISASELKRELESLPNIGRVTVVRSRSLIGYEWDIEFTSCGLKNGNEVCNDGDLLPLEVSDVNLQGCGGPTLTVSELISGRGPDTCPQLSNGLCSNEETFAGQYPIHHEIRELTLGTPYYVQVRLRNSHSHGHRRLSTPLRVTPKHNPPGPPPPVILRESTSTSITVGWEKPRVNGGREVSGYELWMDTWSGGSFFMVYDGAGNPDIMEYRLATNDIGPHSQIVETGRQYRFQVRAINNCDTEDLSRSCFGELSEMQAFTVREPRAPLPPLMPQRDADTRVKSANEATIAISWFPPVDNGGSPITGYILYMKDYDGEMTSYVLDHETTKWHVDSLRTGQVYRFHVVALNSFGKSGNSPVLTTVAAMNPGLSYAGVSEFSNPYYMPVVIDVQERSLTVKWSHPQADIAGGSPIIGFKLYMYKFENPLLRSNADPIKEEVQHIIISSDNESVGGTFTIIFLGYETTDIAADATEDMVKYALENLPGINLVHVDSIFNGWSITFLSEAGDLPLLQVTSGRLSHGAKIAATEITKGDFATFVYDGSEIPGLRTFEVTGLAPNAGYAFKVAPVNAVGDGILSAASVVTIATAGASASKTTASGSALSKGIAGSIQEVQIVTFLSTDCSSDRLVLSYESSDDSKNLCGATAYEFEAEIEDLGTGNVHVSREEASSPTGHFGYSWTVTFNSRFGDIPMLTVDHLQVGNGRDAQGRLGQDGIYVVEFLRGQSNEFIIEPKTASGSVVKDLSASGGIGEDIFFTELWTSDASIVDGSHIWYSDGGLSTYNPVLYIEQLLSISADIGAFHLSMDTSETQPLGRIDGVYSQTRDITDISTVAIQNALADLPNVGKVQVTRRSDDNDFMHHYFVVTFRNVFGEYPLLAASDPSVIISRNNGHMSATEIQTIRLSADKPFTYEIQMISISSDNLSFDLSFKSGPRTNSIPCNFGTAAEASDAAGLVEAELNSLPGLKVQVDGTVSGAGMDDDPWKFRVTFREPVGPLPLLESDNAEILQVLQGDSSLIGSLVLSYQGEYTGDIPFDASAKTIKDSLEMLDTIEGVNVKKVDIYTGYQWVISFTGHAGNLPLLVAHNNVFEIQSIEISGGNPTPIGGVFTLSYLAEETGMLSFDSSADIVKTSLESLPSIDHVDVSCEMFENGQSRWLVTFRVPREPVLLGIDSSRVTGSIGYASVSVEKNSQSSSLVAKVGSSPTIIVEEKVPGFPSYTGQYRAAAAGNYSLAVLQLESGGLNAQYFDNQWFMEEPVIERVDPGVNFNWGSGVITQYGRDYISVRWWGKIRPLSSEPYTFFLGADDGARLYLDHVLVIDIWEQRYVQKKATVELTAGVFHDLKVEYKEITGDANLQLEWSSRSLRKQAINPSQLYHPSHIVGSPFRTTITAGAADYPYSDIIEIEGQNITLAVAGERTSFLLQARDSSGNARLFSGDASDEVQWAEEHFTVDIVGDQGSISGDITYLESGQHRVDYTVLKAGTYRVHVKTGGTDIYCGLGEENKCSPFSLTVLPGATLASNCEAESSFDPVDYLVEARAGEIGTFYLQSKDAFGNNRNSGGDEVIALFKSASNPDIQYRGNVKDGYDGSYQITYSIPVAGSYLVSITIGGEAVQYCVGPSGERWHSRDYDGSSVYTPPPFCSLGDDLFLHVIHRELHGVASSLTEDNLLGLSSAVVGVETGFTIESRDKFGNVRSGSSTSNIVESGDGMSDAFLISLVGPKGNTVITSSAVEILSSLDSSVPGYFRLSYGGRVTGDIPHNFSAAAMQVVLSSLHNTGSTRSAVQVSRSDVNGNYQWKITFVDHLELWSQYPLSVLPNSDGSSSVSDTMFVAKLPLNGIYPVRYTVWETGTYELSVFTGSTLVSGSSYTIEVSNGTPQASSSYAVGLGLETGVAGEASKFEVYVRDRRQSEIQSIMTSATVIEFINEVQRVRLISNAGETFHLEFRGQKTVDLEIGVSTLSDVTNALESLPSIENVDVTSDGSNIIQNGDSIDVEFLTEHGGLDLIRSSGPEEITRIIEGEAPYRAERQVFNCNANGGYFILSFKELTATIEFDEEIGSVAPKISALIGHPVSIVDPDDSVPTICSGSGEITFIDFPAELGNVEPISVSFDALDDGSISLLGNGEEHFGAVNGISPIMGYFTLSYDSETTDPIGVDATAGEVKIALENLQSIGSVSVTKDLLGTRESMDGKPPFSIWSITFADENEDGCEPGSWDKCPANIGDLPPLVIDSTLVVYDIGATQLQPAPIISNFEVVKGSAGNAFDDTTGQSILDFSLAHNLMQGVGIEMNEAHTLSCSYSSEALLAADPTGSFELIILNKRILIDAQASLYVLNAIVSQALELKHPVSFTGSTHETICHFDRNNPTMAVTKLRFSKDDGPIPKVFVQSEQSVVVSATNDVDAVDKVEYLGGGRYLLTYTPTITGHYSVSVKLDDKHIWTDLSSGVFIYPSNASAHSCSHNSNLVAVAGNEESFTIVARDRFGNMLSSVESKNATSLIISLEGVADGCNNATRHDYPNAATEVKTGNSVGHYRIVYTPKLSGVYLASVMLRSQGGLLATYFKNQDFSQPVIGNSNHNLSPYHETPWCAAGKPACDSTRLDLAISFDWGFESPLDSDPSFPMDSFSVLWAGELKVATTEEYIFTVHLNGDIRLTIGQNAIIDSLENTSAASLTSIPIVLEKDIFYPFQVEYVHSMDEAKIQLFWESSSVPKQIVPSSMFYYSRHISGSSPSPFSVTVAPGAIDTSSTATGDGLTHCVAMEECSFVIQTKDFNENNRFNDGSNPGFEIDIIGSGDWAGEGRINGVVSSTPAVVSEITLASNDWQYIGDAYATHLSTQIATSSSFVGMVSRGDKIVVDGSLYTISPSGIFDSSRVPLFSPYLGPTKSIPVFKASKTCASGTHTVKYTPLIRGSYDIDVRLPSVAEIQRVTTSALTHSSLSGSFTLTFLGGMGSDPLVSGSVAYDATTEDFKIALESIETIGSVEVSLHNCDDPGISCSWNVTFLSLDGDVHLLEPNKVHLGGVSDVRVAALAEGRRSKSLSGFSRTINVLPGSTSPSRTVALGRGLTSATAGQKSVIVIQPKDSYGNDRLADQEQELFAVYIYPEQGDNNGSFPVTKGTIHREGNESGYTVEYTPKASGFHTIAVVQATSTKTQIITTKYNSKARGGTFSIELGNLSTLPISWDADSVALKNALEYSMGSLSLFSVQKQAHGLLNFKYTVSFDTLIGNVPNLSVDTSNLIGNSYEWDVTSPTDGRFSHILIIDDPKYETQSIRLTILDQSSLTGATFALKFMGLITDSIPWDADDNEVAQKLKMLSTIGDILVSLNDGDITFDRSWRVTFNPYEGTSPNSLINFGNLTPIEVVNVDSSISVDVETVEDGTSPFRVFVSPAEPAPTETTVYDYNGVRHFEGLSTGVYKSDSHFFIQSRDEFSNEIIDGPLREVQIIETSSSSQIGGFFEVSMFETKVRVHASAFTSELEKKLISIPGVGSLTVSSNSAKNLVVGKSAAVTKGRNTIVPSQRLTEFVVGDWIRIGDKDEGQLFSITDMADVAPFTVTLSSSFWGQSSESSNIYQHGLSQNRRGYQYIVSFDSLLGDVPNIGVDGKLLEGDDAKIELTSCDWNVNQSLKVQSTSSSLADGYFYLVYGNSKTRALSVSASADELENAILSDINTIHSLSVTSAHNHVLGSYSWALHLKSFDDDAQLFFAEGHLLEGGTIVATVTCPVASEDRPESRVESVAGRRGQNFIVALDGPTTVHGGVRHIESGRYFATYRTPRVGEYSLSIQSVLSGGLFGEYFSNQKLHGSSTLTRVDQALDFQWSNSDFLTTTARDFVSVRWTGYIKPAFNEVYTFTAHVNDGLRLWIGDELLIDKFDNEVDVKNEYVEFSASTVDALKPDQLVAVKVEYRENRGSALIRLQWESISQPFAVIDQPRLFFNASHIHGSPFEVSPLAIKPPSPRFCNVDIVAWDSLQVTWSAPIDDGGSAVNKYLVESWSANEYGTTENQQLRIKRTITGGLFSISMHSRSTDVPIGSSALDFELLMESLPDIGDVKVTKIEEANEVVYNVEFLLHNSPVPIMNIEMHAVTPENARGEYCVCAKSSTSCASSGFSNDMSCDSGSTRESTVITRTHEVLLDKTTIDNGSEFSHVIQGLIQPSTVSDGFGVRISAGNTEGYGKPCPSLFLKPYGPPLPPAIVELRRVASDPSSLALHFTSVMSPEDKGSIVSAYFVEWSTSEGFETGTVANATLSAESIRGARLPSFNPVNKVFNYYSIVGLLSGIDYFVRISAVNEAGIGPKSLSSPLSLAPGFKPTDLEDQSGVRLSTLLPDEIVSVAESSSTLRVSWRAPFSDNGFGVSNYLIEYWLSSGVQEVQELNLLSPNGGQVRGTFALSYGGDTTDSLSVDSSAEMMKSALESLSTIREVKVWRSGNNPAYKWTVTFVSEFPSISGRVLLVDESTELADSFGGVPILLISVSTPGVLPIGYGTKVVAVDDPLQTHFYYLLTDLSAGNHYSVQVSAENRLGYGRPQTSIPNKLAPPVQKPSSPTNVLLSVSSSHSLEVIFSSPESDGGETVTLYRIEWDTEPEFDSLKSSPLGSYSLFPPQNDSGCEPCKHQITGLIKGRDYFVRVYAYNSHGYSVKPGVPSPQHLSPKTTPDPPRVLHIVPQSETKIQVSFPPTDDDGGAPVTKYKIEWNMMSFSARMASMNIDHTALLYSPYNVQTISLSAEADDLGGVFRIAFGGHATEEIAAKSTANDVKLALDSLPTIGSVSVSRDYRNGLVWVITFLANLSNESKFGPIELLSVSADPAALPTTFGTNISGASGSSLTGTGVRLEVKEVVTAYKGFEQQTLTTQCHTSAGVLGGTFALAFEGSRTNEIPFDVSASDLRLNIESLSSIGTVKVVRRKTSKNSFQWTIIFLDRLGNVPLLEVHDHLTCSGGSDSALVFVTETVQGVLPRMDGPHSGRVELNATAFAAGHDIVHSVGGLTPGMNYHFRVSAWNGAESSYGAHRHSSPSLIVPMAIPDPPSSIEMSSIDDSTILISWDASLARGVQQITEFKVELAEETNGVDSHSEVTIFAVLNMPEIQEIILETTADDMGGYFKVRFMDEVSSNISTNSDEEEIKDALERISTIEKVEVSILPHTQDFMFSYGRRWVISFTSQLGNLPSMLVDTGSGLPSTIATGGTLRGSSSVVRVQTIFDGGLPTSFITPSILSSNKKYRSRVLAFNGHSWSVPSVSKYSISPSKGAPSPPRKVRVNILSDTKVGVSWTQPSYSGGDPIASYRLEWDNDSMFNQFSSTVSHVTGTEDYYFVIKNLDPLESYFVRVMAYSAMGFSEPVLAVPLLSETQTIAISLIEMTGTVDYSETFAFGYMTENGFQRTTNPISVYAIAQFVEDELNKFAHVSVDREDHSLAFDSSGSETKFFSILYRVTFFGEEGNVALSIVDDNLGQISATIESQ